MTRSLHASCTAGAAALVAAAVVLGASCRKPPQEDPAPPLPRERLLLAGPWRFAASNDLEGAQTPDFNDRAWQQVTVPHTWGSPVHRVLRRGWYRFRLDRPAAREGRRTYLLFEGVAAVADVYLNGRRLGRHKGAYTRFAFDATEALVPGRNLLALKVSNHPDDMEDSLPSSVSRRQHYHVFGGITRKVWLVETAPIHVDPLDDASSGVYVSANHVTSAGADLSARILVRNAGSRPQAAELRVAVGAPDGRVAFAASRRIEIPAWNRVEETVARRMSTPRLWSPDTPHLYTLSVELWSGGALRDRVEQRFGFRTFELRKEGFFLNGAPLRLLGVGKHQESERNGAALTDEEIEADFRELKDLGVNFVRLAHYPHSELAYDIADRSGLLVWAENGNSSPARGSVAGERITREMVRQYFNHPSIVMWCVGNEVDYRGVDRYAAAVKAEDPSRLVVYASNSGVRPRLRQLDLVAHNVYRGWYRGDPWEWSDRLADLPLPRLVSEAGAGSMVTHHTEYRDARRTVDEFEPEEYRQLHAEAQLTTVFVDCKQELPLYSAWVLRDFAADKYNGLLNTKGFLTGGGLRKDAFALYQIFLRPGTPIVHLASKTYFVRPGPTSDIKAYSNRQRLSLRVNGKDRGTRENGAHRHANGRQVPNVFFWSQVLEPGCNEVEALAEDGAADRASFVLAARDGLAPLCGQRPPIEDLRSSNRTNPAYLLSQPIEAEWPVYTEFDGTADNTFGPIPSLLKNARRIATRRLSKPQNRTDLSFRAIMGDRSLELFVLLTNEPRLVRHFTRQGFSDTRTQAEWRTNDLRLVRAAVLRREVGPGQEVRLEGTTGDYVVLVRERDESAPRPGAP
jgi:beta-galactosidase